jgi:hypothetical protein
MPILTKDQLVKLYVNEKKSCIEIATEIGCHRLTVLRNLQKNNIPRRNCGGKTFEKHSVYESYFDNWSASMAYLLGYISADGCVRPDKYELSIKSIDYELLNFVRKELGASWQIKDYGHIYSLGIYSGKIVRKLISLGINQRKSYNFSFPFIDYCYFWHFLRGYVDGDGHIEPFGSGKTRGRLCITGTKEFLQDLIVLLYERIDCFNLQKLRPAGTSFTLRVSGRGMVEILRKLYANDEFALRRKKIVAIDIVNCFENKQNCPICGKEFMYKIKGAKYCSANCKGKGKGKY